MNFPEIIGQSPAMQEVFALMQKVIESDSTVLILGESGTGKEMVARAIHERGARWAFPLVTVNCGAIPEGLLESELFGHARGSFTGAIENHRGKFEVANHGTLFLDEIGDMSPKLQVKLLRVLQERKLESVGANKLVDVDVRVIAATNKDLEKAVQTGIFREDLYYRLNVIPIPMPPLRNRKQDIPGLLEYFLKKYTAENQHPIAVVLGCIDSRVPVETIFDMGFGDLFCVRIAGNVVNNDIKKPNNNLLFIFIPMVIILLASLIFLLRKKNLNTKE